MRLRLLPIVALSVAACGPALERGELSAQRPFLRLSVDTTPVAGAVSSLPAAAHEFALSSTFAFDNDCSVASTGLVLRTRVDAAREVQLVLGPWKEADERFRFACADAADCPRSTFHLHWVANGRRHDASPARREDGLPAGTSCSAGAAADALDASQFLLEGTCTNLLGRSAGEAGPVFGPVQLSFSALCRRAP